MNWTALFWALCRAFPGQFRRETFAAEPLSLVLAAVRELHEQQRQEHYLGGLATAQLTSLTYNINRDPKKGKATSADDWALFAPQAEDEEDQLPPVVAHICIALRHEERLPPLLVAIWREVIKASQHRADTPAVRLLVSDDQSVALVAPSWEGRNVRAFLAAKGHHSGEVIQLHDLDRPLLRYQFRLPAGIMPVHFQAGVLLVNAEQAAVERLLPASSS